MTREIPGVAPHPLADAAGDGWVLSEVRSSVVALTPAVVSLLSSARMAGLVPILATDERSTLTPALSQVWRDAGGAWVVRSSAGLRDGWSGRRLDAVLDVLHETLPRDPDELALRYLAGHPATNAELTVIVSVRHRAAHGTQLGQVAEQVAAATGHGLIGWGPHEPAVAAWDRAAVTRFARERMPDESLLVAAGPGVLATLVARRTSSGVEEITTATIDVGRPSTVAFDALLARLDGALRELWRHALPLVGFVAARSTGAPLQVPPFAREMPAPQRLLIGPAGLRAMRVRAEEHVERLGAEAVGRPRMPSLLYRLGGAGGEPWRRLDRVLAAVDPGALDELLYGREEWRRGTESSGGGRGVES